MSDDDGLKALEDKWEIAEICYRYALAVDGRARSRHILARVAAHDCIFADYN